MQYLYNIILYQPFLNAMVFFYNTIAFGDLGLAIIFLTTLVRLLLFPIFQKSTKHQMVMQRLQPKLKKIQEDHHHNPEQQTKAMMSLYREHQVNPFSGFFLLLLQLPILIALYHIVLNILKPGTIVGLYSFIQAPQNLSHQFLGLINLEERSIVIVGLAALAQYVQMRLGLPKAQEKRELSTTERMGRQMIFIGPILTFVIFYNFPSAIGLYWLTTSLFSVPQQAIINRQQHGELGPLHNKTD